MYTLFEEINTALGFDKQLNYNSQRMLEAERRDDSICPFCHIEF